MDRDELKSTKYPNIIEKIKLNKKINKKNSKKTQFTTKYAKQF